MEYQGFTQEQDVSATFEDVPLQWKSGDIITSATVRLTHRQTRSTGRYINVDSLTIAQGIIDNAKREPVYRNLVLNSGAVNSATFFYVAAKTSVSAEIVYPVAPGIGYTINLTTDTTNTTAEQL